MRRSSVVLILALVLCFIVSNVHAQYKYDGRQIYPNTIDSTQLDTDLSALIKANSIGGAQFAEPNAEMWFPVMADSTDSSGLSQGIGGWVLDGTNPPTAQEYSGTNGIIYAWGFEADGSGTDDQVFLTFPVPQDYEPDTGDIYLYWFHLDDDGAAADGVTWDGTVQAVGEGEDLFAAGTGMTAVEEICAQSDSALYITGLDIEVEDIAAGDLLTLTIFCDVSASELDAGENAHLIGVMFRWKRKDTP